MRFMLIGLGLVSLVSCVLGAPAAPDAILSCANISPTLAHDGTGFNIYAPMIDGATRVDAHVEMDGVADVYNVAMVPSSTEHGMYELPQSIQGYEHSPISYHLTYMSDHARACDTHQFQADHAPTQHASPRAAASSTAPAPTSAEAPASASAAAAAEEARCSLPAIRHEVMKNDAGQYLVQVMGSEPYSYIDLHATIGSSPETNVRIARNVATAQSSPLTIPAGEGLTYWLTYAINDVACSTGMFATGPLH